MSEYERLLILNSLIISKSQYILENCYISNACLTELQTTIEKAFKNSIFSQIDLNCPTNLGGVNMVNLRWRNDATKSKIIYHMFECYEKVENNQNVKNHTKDSFCWCSLLMHSISKKDLQIKTPSYIYPKAPLRPPYITLSTLYSSFHIAYHDFSWVDNEDFRPPDIITEGINSMNKHKIDIQEKSPNISNFENFLFAKAPTNFQKQITYSSIPKITLIGDLIQSFPIIKFKSNRVGKNDMLLNEMEIQSKMNIGLDKFGKKPSKDDVKKKEYEITSNLIKIYREKKKAFNFILRPLNWDPKFSTKCVKSNYLHLRTKYYDEKIILKKWQHILPHSNKISAWRKTLKERRKKLKPFSTDVKSFAWKFLIQRLSPKWYTTCYFCEEQNIRDQFDHLCKCKNLKRYIEIFGKKADLEIKNYSTNIQNIFYLNDSDNLKLFVVFYIIWKKKQYFRNQNTIDRKKGFDIISNIQKEIRYSEKIRPNKYTKKGKIID